MIPLKTISPLLLLCVLHYSTLFSQSLDCDFPNNPAPMNVTFDCDTSDLSSICINIKVHVLNNSTSPSIEVSDLEILDFIDCVNSILLNSGSRITVSPTTCIHVDSVGTLIETRQDVVDNWNDPLLATDSNALDVFILQEDIGKGYGSSQVYKERVILSIENIRKATCSLFSHELGHAFGLVHTESNGQTYSPASGVDLRECKSRDSCQYKGDYICDTGADPYFMKLQPDGSVVGDSGITLCETILLPNFADHCGDTITPWDIPGYNIMSQYCRDEFSPCQIGLMHQTILDIGSHNILNCNEIVFGQGCADIIIDSDTTWSDGILELCANQRIIITSTGVLTLDSFILTRKDSGDVSCPDFIKEGNWDGIYIEGGVANYEYIPIGGGTSYIGPIGALIVERNSIIEYSNNGIQARMGFGGIEVSKSTFQHNGQIIRARGSLPLTKGDLAAIGVVKVEDSEISVDDIQDFPALKSTQIDVFGASCDISSTSMIYNGDYDDFDITAINSGRGRLTVKSNTEISSFTTGIYKDIDYVSSLNGSKGLYVQDSEILDCEQAIDNRSQICRVTHNILENDVYSIGATKGLWSRNRIRRESSDSGSKSLHTVNVQESNLITENIFETASFTLTVDNKNTKAICNQWKDISAAVLAVDSAISQGGAQVITMESWGTISNASGNKYLDGSPYMSSDDAIINYEISTDPSTMFDYSQMFSGIEAINSANSCSYDSIPSPLGPPIIGPFDYDEGYDLSDLNNYWNEKQEKIDSMQDISSFGSPQDSIHNLQIISDEIVERDQFTRIAIGILSEDDSPSFDTIWKSRIPTLFHNQNDVLSILDSMNWVSTLDTIEGMTIDEDDESDLEVLVEGLEYFYHLDTIGRDITSLHPIQIEYLSDLANDLTGNYSSILRLIVNELYSKRLSILDEEVSEDLKVKNGRINITQDYASFSLEESVSLYPNPTEGCVRIKPYLESFTYSLFSLAGAVLIDQAHGSKSYICFGNIPKGQYLLKLSGPNQEWNQVFLIILR